MTRLAPPRRPDLSSSRVSATNPVTQLPNQARMSQDGDVGIAAFSLFAIGLVEESPIDTERGPLCALVFQCCRLPPHHL